MATRVVSRQVVHDQAGGDTEKIQSIPRVQVWKIGVFIAVRSPDFGGGVKRLVLMHCTARLPKIRDGERVWLC